MEMTELTADDASILAFIARAPKSREAAQLAKRLQGPAKDIAEALMNESNQQTDVGTAAQAMRKWAAAGS